MAGINNEDEMDGSGANPDEEDAMDLYSDILEDDLTSKQGGNKTKDKCKTPALSELERLRQEILQLKQQNEKLKTESEETTQRLQKKDDELIQIRTRTQSCGRCACAVTNPSLSRTCPSPTSLSQQGPLCIDRKPASLPECQRKKRRINPELIVKYPDSNSSHPAFSQVGKGDTFHEYLKIFPDSQSNFAQSENSQEPSTDNQIAGCSQSILDFSTASVLPDGSIRHEGLTDDGQVSGLPVISNQKGSISPVKGSGIPVREFYSPKKKTPMKKGKSPKKKSPQKGTPTKGAPMNKRRLILDDKPSSESSQSEKPIHPPESNVVLSGTSNGSEAGTTDTSYVKSAPTKTPVANTTAESSGVQILGNKTVGSTDETPSCQKEVTSANVENKNPLAGGDSANPVESVDSDKQAKRKDFIAPSKKHIGAGDSVKQKESVYSDKQAKDNTVEPEYNTIVESVYNEKTGAWTDVSKKVPKDNDKKTSSKVSSSETGNVSKTDSHKSSSQKSKSSSSKSSSSSRSHDKDKHSSSRSDSHSHRSKSSSNRKDDKSHHSKDHRSDRKHGKDRQSSKSVAKSRSSEKESTESSKQRHSKHKSSHRSSHSKSKEPKEVDKHSEFKCPEVTETPVTKIPCERLDMTPRHQAVAEAAVAFLTFTEDVKSKPAQEDKVGSLSENKSHAKSRHSEKAATVPSANKTQPPDTIVNNETNPDVSDNNCVDTTLASKEIPVPSVLTPKSQIEKRKHHTHSADKREKSNHKHSSSSKKSKDIQSDERHTICEKFSRHEKAGITDSKIDSNSAEISCAALIGEQNIEVDSPKEVPAQRTRRKSVTKCDTLDRDSHVKKSKHSSSSAKEKTPNILNSNPVKSDFALEKAAKPSSTSHLIGGPLKKPFKIPKRKNIETIAASDAKPVESTDESAVHSHIPPPSNAVAEPKFVTTSHPSIVPALMEMDDVQQDAASVPNISEPGTDPIEPIAQKVAIITNVQPIRNPSIKPLMADIDRIPSLMDLPLMAPPVVFNPPLRVQHRHANFIPHPLPIPMVYHEPMEEEEAPYEQMDRPTDPRHLPPETRLVCNESQQSNAIPDIILSLVRAAEAREKEQKESQQKIFENDPRLKSKSNEASIYRLIPCDGIVPKYVHRNLPHRGRSNSVGSGKLSRELDSAHVEDPEVSDPRLMIEEKRQSTDRAGMSCSDIESYTTSSSNKNMVQDILAKVLPSGVASTLFANDNVERQIPNSQSHQSPSSNSARLIQDLLAKVLPKSSGVSSNFTADKNQSQVSVSDSKHRDEDVSSKIAKCFEQKSIEVKKTRQTYPVPKPTKVTQFASDDERLLAYMCLAGRRDNARLIDQKQNQRREQKRVSATRPQKDVHLEGEADFGGMKQLKHTSTVITPMEEALAVQTHQQKLSQEEIDELWNQGVDVTDPDVLAEYMRLRNQSPIKSTMYVPSMDRTQYRDIPSENWVPTHSYSNQVVEKEAVTDDRPKQSCDKTGSSVFNVSSKSTEKTKSEIVGNEFGGKNSKRVETMETSCSFQYSEEKPQQRAVSSGTPPREPVSEPPTESVPDKDILPADTPATTPATTPADTQADTQADTPAETPAETQAETPAETQADTPADTLADTPGDTPAKSPAGTPAGTPAEDDEKQEDQEFGLRLSSSEESLVQDSKGQQESQKAVGEKKSLPDTKDRPSAKKWDDGLELSSDSESDYESASLSSSPTKSPNKQRLSPLDVSDKSTEDQAEKSLAKDEEKDQAPELAQPNSQDQKSATAALSDKDTHQMSDVKQIEIKKRKRESSPPADVSPKDRSAARHFNLGNNVSEAPTGIEDKNKESGHSNTSKKSRQQLSVQLFGEDSISVTMDASNTGSWSINNPKVVSEPAHRPIRQQSNVQLFGEDSMQVPLDTSNHKLPSQSQCSFKGMLGTGTEEENKKTAVRFLSKETIRTREIQLFGEDSMQVSMDSSDTKRHTQQCDFSGMLGKQNQGTLEKSSASNKINNKNDPEPFGEESMCASDMKRLIEKKKQINEDRMPAPPSASKTKARQLELELFGEDSIQVSMNASDAKHYTQSKKLDEDSMPPPPPCPNTKNVQQLELKLFGEDSIQVSMNSSDIKLHIQKGKLIMTEDQQHSCTNPPNSPKPISLVTKDKYKSEENTSIENRPLAAPERIEESSEDESDLDIGDCEYDIDPASVKVDIEPSDGDSCDRFECSDDNNVVFAAEESQSGPIDLVLKRSEDTSHGHIVPVSSESNHTVGVTHESTSSVVTKTPVKWDHKKHSEVIEKDENCPEDMSRPDEKESNGKTVDVKDATSVEKYPKDTHNADKSINDANSDENSKDSSGDITVIESHNKACENAESSECKEDINSERSETGAKEEEREVSFVIDNNDNESTKSETNEESKEEGEEESFIDMEDSSHLSSEDECAGDDEMSEDHDSTLIEDNSKDARNDSCSIASESGGSSINCKSDTEDDLDDSSLIDESLDKTIREEDEEGEEQSEGEESVTGEEKNENEKIEGADDTSEVEEEASEEVEEDPQKEMSENVEKHSDNEKEEKIMKDCRINGASQKGDSNFGSDGDVLDLHADDLSLFDEESNLPPEKAMTPRRSPRKKLSTSTPRTPKVHKSPVKFMATPTRKGAKVDAKSKKRLPLEDGELSSDGKAMSRAKDTQVLRDQQSNKRRRSLSKERERAPAQDSKRIRSNSQRRYPSSSNRRYESPSSRHYLSRDSDRDSNRDSRQTSKYSNNPDNRSENYGRSHRDLKRDTSKSERPERRSSRR